jgi:hypothetical protein
MFETISEFAAEPLGSEERELYYWRRRVQPAACATRSTASSTLKVSVLTTRS